jgi:hypothetical protein
MSEESRKRILLRRAKFIAAALAAGGALSGEACGGTAQVCLKMAVDSGPTGDASNDADAGPQPCLAPILDSGNQ